MFVMVVVVRVVVRVACVCEVLIFEVVKTNPHCLHLYTSPSSSQF
jgi:hypothetical protein